MSLPFLLRLRRQPANNPADIDSIRIFNTSKSRHENACSPTGTEEQRGLNLMSLPTELHLQIAQYLTYPDALSLKHTNRYFFYLVDTGVRLKVEWLMERRMLHLDCPSNQRCDLGSDLRFCRGSVK
jgi:hypothetical protein